MKKNQIFILLFISSLLPYSSYPFAEYKEVISKKYIYKKRDTYNKGDITIPVPEKLNAEQVSNENKKLLLYLNHKSFGHTEYEKAQDELQEFRRPHIGIVGGDEDPTSYYEYQKKILLSVY